MYPRNSASPEPIAIGAVVQISDGVVQTSGCTVRIKPIGVAEGDGAGTTAYSTDGIVFYTPTQGETNYTSFVLIAKKTGCIPVSITVVTSASSTPGTVEHAGTIKTLDALDTAQDAQHGTTQTAIATVDTVVDAIKAKTDQFVFTIANQVDANALSGGGGLDAAGVRSAVGLASANLDTQLADIPTVAEFNARTLAAADYFDPATDVVANVTTVATTTNLTNLPAIPTNWLTAAGLAADAVTEIQSGLATAANLATVAGYLDTEIAAILADTDELQTNQGNWLTATGFSTHSAADVWAVATRVLTAGTNIVLAKGTGVTGFNDIAATDIVSAGAITTLSGAVVNVDLVDTCTTNTDMRGTDSAYTGTPPTVGQIADQVWDEAIAGHAGAGSTGEALSAAGLAGDPWSTALPGAYGAGTAGKIIGDNIDAAITSRMATYTQPTGFLAATFPTMVASTTNITAATGITVATNNDKTGYSLTTTTGLGNQTANITGNLSGSVGSVTGNVATLAGAATVVLTDSSLTTAKLGTFALAKGTNITGFNDITAAQVEAAILDEGDATALLAAIAAKVEEFLVNEGDATATIAAIATACNSAIVAGAVGSNVTAIKAKTDNLPASPAAVGSAMTLAADAITTAAIANNAITGAKFAANALNGLGDWNTIAPATPTNVSDAQTAIIAQVDANETKIDTGNAILAKIDSGLEADGSGGYQGTALFLENAPSGGGGGLTAQQTRDAMKLAPSAGAPAAGSIDQHLDDIETTVDALNVGAGAGARTITVTVDDGTDPLENVIVRFTEGATTRRALTNASGVRAFGLDDATWNYAATKDGYDAETGTLVVSADAPLSISLTATAITIPDDPALSTLVVKCVNEYGAVEEGVTIECKMSAIPSSGTGIAYDGTVQTATSGADGNAELTVVRLATYLYKRGSGNVWKSVAIANSASQTVTSVIGAP